MPTRRSRRFLSLLAVIAGALPILPRGAVRAAPPVEDFFSRAGAPTVYDEIPQSELQALIDRLGAADANERARAGLLLRNLPGRPEGGSSPSCARDCATCTAGRWSRPCSSSSQR